MRKIEISDVRDLVEYEKVREQERARIITRKRSRRVSLGDNLSLLFENRDTVLFQIQEMVRTERIVEPARIQEEVDSYNALIPDSGELSATLFIEIPELVSMTADEVRAAVNRFQGLDREGVRLEAGAVRIPARFEAGHSSEEKMAAVHYLRFAVSAQARQALEDGNQVARLVADHPRYQAEATLPPEVRRELLEDLAA